MKSIYIIVLYWIILTGSWRCVYDSHVPTPYIVSVFSFDNGGIKLVSGSLREEDGLVFGDNIIIIKKEIVSVGKILSPREFSLVDYHIINGIWTYGGSTRIFKKESL